MGVGHIGVRDLRPPLDTLLAEHQGSDDTVFPVHVPNPTL